MTFLLERDNAHTLSEPNHITWGCLPAKSAADLEEAARDLPASSFQSVVALHDTSELRRLIKQLLKPSNLTHIPVTHLGEYFGTRVHDYFFVMNSYTRSLTLPSLALTIMALLQRKFAKSVRISIWPALAARSVVIAWALLFARVLRRLDFTNKPQRQKGARSRLRIVTRKERSGTAKSGLERDNSQRAVLLRQHAARICMLAGSAVATTSLLSAVTVLVVVSMNCQGLILEGSTSRFVIPALLRLTAPGRALDPRHPLKRPFYILLHTILISLARRMYMALVVHTTCWDDTGRSGLAVKSCAFELLRSFLPYCWLKLAEVDRSPLSSEVVQYFFMADELCRMTCVTVYPHMRRFWAQRDTLFHTNRSDVMTPWASDGCTSVTAADGVEQVRAFDVPFQEWRDLDCWLKMCLQFTYVVFLGAELPFTFHWSLFVNTLEVRTDILQVCCCRRPLPDSVDRADCRQFRIWYELLQHIALLGATANIAQTLCTLQQRHRSWLTLELGTELSATIASHSAYL